MSIEYKTNWDAKWCDILNKEVPSILKDVKFEEWESKLNVANSGGGTYKITGQKYIKLILTSDKKEHFVLLLKHGNVLDDNFPNLVREFIYVNLGHRL